MKSVLPAIAINGRFLTQRVTGVQRFAIETIKAIDALLDTPAYASLKGRVEIVAPPKARAFELKNIPLVRRGFSNGYFWEQIELPLHAAGRLLLNLCMLGPVGVRHQIVVVHDATVQALPENFSWQFRTVYRFLIPRLCRRADTVVTVSEFSRQEIGNRYGVNTDGMPICYEGGDHIFAVPADTSVLDRFELADGQFFFSVGIQSGNKNIDNLVAAFHSAGLGDTQLVLTGKRDARVHGNIEDIQSTGVRNIGFVSDAELRALYEHALALVFPSRYEGFGLPPLEAMTCGCPVIISDQAALVEVCGEAALRCGMDDVPGLARLMRTVHDDQTLRERLKASGHERARRFTWRKTAEYLLDRCIEASSRRTG